MNRSEISTLFDQAFASLEELRHHIPEYAVGNLDDVMMKLASARFISLISCVGYAPIENSVIEAMVSSVSSTKCEDYITKRIVKSLSDFSPGQIDPTNGAELIVSLLARTPLGVAPDMAAELTMIRYCRLNDIDECSASAAYLEVVIREGMGLISDVPPSEAEVHASVKNGIKVLAFLRRQLRANSTSALKTREAA